MADGLIISGVTKEIKDWTLEYSRVINGVGVLSCELVSLDASYRPAMDIKVLLSVASATIYGGWVRTVREVGLGRHAVQAISTHLSAPDFGSAFDNIIVTEAFGSSTLKSRLTTLVAYFSSYGITLHASQVNGPTMDAATYTEQKVSAILAEFVALTGYYWQVDTDLKLRMIAPGTFAAPADVDEGDICIGDIEVEPTRQQYANYVRVRYYEPAIAAYGYLGTGGGGNFSDTETITIGTKTYTYQTTLTDVDGHVLIGATEDDSLANLTAAITGAAGAGSTYAASTILHPTCTSAYSASTRIKVSAITAGVAGNAIPVDEGTAHASWTTEGGGGIDRLALGEDRTLTTVTASDAGEIATHGRWDSDPIQARDDVTTGAGAQDIADAYLAIYLASSAQIVTYDTYESGFEPGQYQHILVTDRDVDDDFIVMEVRARSEGSRLRYTITAFQGTLPPGTFRDTYRRWDGAAVALGA